MIKILELFSGYGTATFALKRLGIAHQVIGYSDIDKYANKCFQQNHGGKELGDVKLINPNSLEDFDLLTGGFPCQSFSTAGKQLGELDARGTLFNEIIRIAEVKKPKYMLLENVKNLTSKRFKLTFNKILSELDRIGYHVYWKILNSVDYGIPQSRQRVWFVCFRKDIDYSFSFPKEIPLTIKLDDLLFKEVDKKYYLTEIQHIKFKDFNNPIHSLYPRSSKSNKGGVGHLSKENLITYRIDCGNTQFIDVYNKKFQKICPAITLPHHCGLRLFTNDRYRKLTPIETFRLMGFLNDEINLEGLSDNQKYKLAGNGQDVNVVSLIFKEMKLE